MKGKIAQRHYYDTCKPAVREAMDEFDRADRPPYDLVERYRMDDAEYALVGMGCMMETAEADRRLHPRARSASRWAWSTCTATGPFPATEIVEALKQREGACASWSGWTTRCAPANPLMQDIKAPFMRRPDSDEAATCRRSPRLPKIFSCSAGLGSRDVRAGRLHRLVQNMRMAARHASDYFAVGIKHPLALPMDDDPDVRPKGAFSHARPLGRRVRLGDDQQGHRRRSPAKCSACTCRRIRSTARRRRACRRPTTSRSPTTHIRPHCELEHVEFIPLNDVNAFRTPTRWRACSRAARSSCKRRRPTRPRCGPRSRPRPRSRS